MQFDLAVLIPHLDMLRDGAILTIEACALALLGSFITGALVAIASTSVSRPWQLLANIYVDVFRNVPFIVQMFFFYYGLPVLGLYLDAFTTGVIALSIAGGAYTSNVIRSGILAIDPGIIEAAQVSGLAKHTIFSKIVMPIALRTSIRPLGSVLINLILTSSILSTITLNELTGSAKIVASDTFRPFEVYFVLLVVYAALTYSVSIAIGVLHRRLNHGNLEGVS